jgi:hypothetical protein
MRGDKIYFATSGGRIKIGVSRDVEKRLRGIDIHLPEPIMLLGAVAGSIPTEKLIHERLKPHHIRGEWFRICPETLALASEYLNKPQRDWIFVSRLLPQLAPPKRAKSPRIAAVMAKARQLWPHKTAEHIAAATDSSIRSANYWLSGKRDPGGHALDRLMQATE